MKKFFIPLCIFFFSSAVVVSAATLSITAPSDVHPGERIIVDVLVDTQDVQINSGDISLSFPPSLFVFKGYAPDAGVLSLWLTAPHEESPGIIHLSGITPGGFDRIYDPEHPNVRTVTLARLFFEVRDPGVAELRITHAELLRNDGHGTSVPVSTTPRTISVGGARVSPSSDVIIPIPFTIHLVPSVGKTPRLAVFEATDEGGGIEHYEVKQETGTWHIATSPYPVPHRLFSYTMTVRAFDFSGNYRDQSITIGGENPTRTILLSILFVLIIVFLRKRYTHE